MDYRWGAAGIEIGFISIELNITPASYEYKDSGEPEEISCCLDYFCCCKDKNGEWWSKSYLNEDGTQECYKVTVDFSRADWKAWLEKDMLEKLMAYVKEQGLHMDSTNELK